MTKKKLNFKNKKHEEKFINMLNSGFTYRIREH